MRRDNNLVEALKKILQQENAKNHQEIAVGLKKQGYNVNQSTISRLLRKVHAIKGLNAKQQTVYKLALPHHEALTTVTYSHLVLKITHNEHLIIIHTTPGSASMIAQMLDAHHSDCHILGTIAGDDTILVVPSSILTLKKTLEATKQLVNAGNYPPETP